jgi:hypothetical protein
MALKMACVAKYQMAITCDAHGKSNGENGISGGNVAANASALRWAASARLRQRVAARAGDAPRLAPHGGATRAAFNMPLRR